MLGGVLTPNIHYENLNLRPANRPTDQGLPFVRGQLNCLYFVFVAAAVVVEDQKNPFDWTHSPSRLRQ